MLPFTLFACMTIQIALAIKIYMLNPYRRLNKYLAMIPALYVISTVIEINIYFTTDAVYANQIYHIYQGFAFLPLILSTLGYMEYIRIYTSIKIKKTLWFIEFLVILSNGLSTLIVVFYGPPGRIFLSAPGRWSIDYNSMGFLFFLHTYSSVVWLVLSVCIFIYLTINAESGKKKRWFGTISFFQLLVVTGIVYFIASHSKTMAPQYDMATSIPATILVFLQLWVLSNFTIFDINPKNIYNEVLAATNNWVIVLDKKGSIRYINNIAVEKIEINYYQLIYGNINDVMEVKKTFNTYISPSAYLLGQTETKFSEIVVRFKKTCKSFNLQASQKKIFLPDKTEAILWVLIDTTLMEAMKIQKDIIEATSAKLEKAYNDITFVVNITSHDIRAPLETLVELVDLVLMEDKLPMPNRREEYLGYIAATSLQSLTLYKHMLEYLKNGSNEKKRECINVSYLIRYVKERLITAIEKNGAIITYEGLSEIYCNPEQIRELLANFTDNAIKYRSSNPPLINIEISESETMYHFSVKDNGMGINPLFIPKLFKEYVREGKIETAGTGMGLYLCKKIVEACNGEISINNNVDKGVIVLFTIGKLIGENNINNKLDNYYNRPLS